MFRFVVIAVALFSFSRELAASPACVVGTLDTYLATTCTAFGIDFTGWSYGAGGTPVGASDIIVFPSVTGPVFEFTVTTGEGWAAGPGATRTPSIFFSATSSSAAVGSRLFLAFGTTSGTGSVFATLNECLGDLFAGGCLGTATSLVVTPPTLLAENAFGGSFTPIDLQLNMTISGGTGDAQISSMEAGLFVVPEPRTASLMAMALAMAALRKRFPKKP